MSTDRLDYILRRKEFCNQKTYELFEKYQTFILVYVGFAITIFLSYKDSKFTTAQIEQISSIFFYAGIFFFLIFIVFHIFNVISWVEYDREEHALRNETHRVDLRSIAKWIEFWIIPLSLIETIVAAYLVSWIFSLGAPA